MTAADGRSESTLCDTDGAGIPYSYLRHGLKAESASVPDSRRNAVGVTHAILSSGLQRHAVADSMATLQQNEFATHEQLCMEMKPIQLFQIPCLGCHKKVAPQLQIVLPADAYSVTISR